MPFERFRQRKGRARYGFPVATLQASGGMSLNDLVYAQLGQPSHIILSFDPDERLIGLEPSRGEEDYAFPVRRSGGTEENKNWALSIRSFYAYYDIDVQVTRRYKVVEQENMAVIDLNDEPVYTAKLRIRRHRGDQIKQDGNEN